MSLTYQPARCEGADLGHCLATPRSTTGTTAPVAVAGLTGATSVTTNARHACARIDDGSLRCWGRGGVLGDGTNVQRSIPVTVVSDR